MSDDYANPKSIAETDWEPRALFDGAITTYHATRERRWTCSNGQSETACRASNAGRVETITELEPLPLASPQMYVSKNVYTTTSGTYQAGDRRRKETQGLVSDADDYRTYVKAVTEFEQANVFPLVENTTRHVENGFDPTYRVQTSSEVLFTEIPDPYDHHRAVTTWTYDMSTGVKLTTRSPNNHATGLVETYSYDPTKRFVTGTVNEKGHAVYRDYHVGTGALLTEFGPNSHWCGWGCMTWEQSWTDIDGLGRPLASWVNRENAGGSWVRTQVGRYKYVDQVIADARTNVETGTLIEYDTNRWTNEKTELDGRGRPDIVTVSTAGAANAVTSYDYDHRGHLVAVTLPDPSQNNAATVEYRYGYDSLGRPTSMRRPAVGGPNASGIDLSYDGLVHSRNEVAGSQGGPAARTDLLHDAFGRLVEVREYTSPTAYETTTYKYDANDNVRSIQNPEGIVTELFHDFEGRRTKIVRHGRTWTYGYWPGGQLKFETAHYGAGSPTAYTTSYAYDTIGRESSRTVGRRNLTQADAQRFGVDTITFGYDTCTNGIGRLCSSTHPWGVLYASFGYDAEGNPTLETRTFKFAGFEASRTSRMTYGPGGRVASQTYADHSANPYDGTFTKFEYDERALPKAVKWQNGAALRTVADQVRNTAGLVTTRYSSLQAAGWNESQSNWTYDPLTRVKSQQVVQVQGGLGVELAKQELDYFGQDDPQRLKHWMRRSTTQTSFYDMTYGYDRRHQLTATAEAAGKYYSLYAFTPSGKLDFVYVGGTPGAGNDVFPRYVSYLYDNVPGFEPDAPVGLKNLNTGSYIRFYGYDTAGNMTSRSGGGTPVDAFLYDGEDQLRRATSTAGGTTTYEEYFYDHTGARAGVVKRNASNAVTEVRVFMGDAEVVYSGSGSLTKTFAHLSLGTPVARITNRTDIELQYHGLSNNTLVSVAPNGTTKSAFVYGPYGDLLETAGTALPDQHRRFNDKYRDDLTKLSYYGVRYYDGVLLGWTQADPLFRFAPDAAWQEPRRASLHTFSLNNPIRYIDPDGRNPALALTPPAAAAAAVALGIATGALSEPKTPAVDGEAALKATAVMAAIPVVGLLGVGIAAGIDHVAGNSGGKTWEGRGLEFARPKPTPATPASDKTKTETRSADTTGTTTAPPVPPGCPPGGTGRRTTERQRGDRMKESDSLQTALDQEQGISEAQQQARRKGAGDATIQSRKKTQQNVDNRLSRLKCLQGALDDEDTIE